MYEIIKDKSDLGIKAIENGFCLRCLGKTLMKDCFNVWHCLECFKYQEITSEKTLVRFERKLIAIDHELSVDFSLTKLQKKASTFLVNCYKKRKNSILEAVCGAGKTEICLEVIKEVLQENKSVAFVIPRVQIIKQLSRRLTSYFPKTNITSLYEGKRHDSLSPLIVLTPQQLIKFYDEFQLMIIDEVDAFPLKDNPFLSRLIKKAVNKDGVIIFMTATITKDLKKMIDEGEEYHSISRRHHYKDLIVPKFFKINGIDDKSIIQFIKKYLSNNNRLIIYVSSIKKAQVFKEILMMEQIDSKIITSKTKYKNEVLKIFKLKEVNVLISTTILERGVTFHNINVIVLEADQEIFNKSTLVQIAGRVGRLDDEGEVYFMSKFITKAMKKAKKKIENDNRKTYEM